MTYHFSLRPHKVPMQARCIAIAGALASGAVVLALPSGAQITPDGTLGTEGSVVTEGVFIQNSLSELPEGILNTESLIANSCVVRNEDGSSTFVITGSDGLPERPGDPASQYPTGDVQSISDESSQRWEGEVIVEAQEIYQLPNGELVMSHACSN